MPPAKDSANGKIAVDRDTKKYPIKVPITSITPVNEAIKRAFPLLIPTESIGAIITIPSGMFCKAMPPAIVRASASFPVPKPTPAAIPSGKLCIAIASTNSRILLTLSAYEGCFS